MALHRIENSVDLDLNSYHTNTKEKISIILLKSMSKFLGCKQ